MDSEKHLGLGPWTGIASLNPALPNDAGRAALRGLGLYAGNKFRNLARQLGAPL